MRVRRGFILGILVFIFVIFLGSFLYQQIEGWSFLDSVYFTVVTATTIGYGDLVPRTNLGKIFTIFFSFFGITMFFYFIFLITGFFFDFTSKRRVHKFKENIRKKDELNEAEVLKRHAVRN